MHTLTVYCHAVKGSMPTIEEAIGIVCEPFSEDESSNDLLYVDLAQLS